MLLLIIDTMHVVIVSPQCFNIFCPIPSKPVDFLMSSLSMFSSLQMAQYMLYQIHDHKAPSPILILKLRSFSYEIQVNLQHAKY